ncbi:hypothetical protein MLD38_039867 [Melastoma candidum]|uniref:Uncharacterized protein n=1 Tax=Melastoma candidum TaxID=119954 RepID=A0ACB9L3H1_9MYRT|nr:hypothetical protein MLD38_039867 [Melastoma candidum]
MGCCPSHPYNSPAPLSNSLAAKPTADGTPPLPPQDDVKETVKEVLTETQPLTPKFPALNPIDLAKDHTPCLPKQSASIKASKPHVPPGLPDDLSEDRSSEICSRSESFVLTTDDNSSSAALLRAVASKGEGRRSNSSCSPVKKPPARMQSPVRRGQVRMVGGPKADPGERSGRRSRSPATRVGRTESGRRTDPSPGRSRRGNVNREELIENPVVSLECFIFL